MHNRDYLSNYNGTYSSSREEGQSADNLIVFLKNTYQLFASSLLAATAGAYIGLDMVSTIKSWYWGLVILEIAYYLGCMQLRIKQV